MTDYPDVTARFEAETKQHEMTVLLDQGLYRHLKFQGPRNELYWFEIVTAPGQLTFSGDGDSFVFRATEDMFELFRQSTASGGINAGYWAQKVRTGNAKSYSRKRFEAQVEKQIAAAEARFPGLRDDVEEEVYDSALYDVSYESSAFMAVLGYEYQAPESTGDPFRFRYVYEWDLQDLDWWFLFACHAVVDGIRRYDAWKAEQGARGETADRTAVDDAVRRALCEKGGFFTARDVRALLASLVSPSDEATTRALLDRLTSDGTLIRISHRGRLLWQATRAGEVSRG